MADCTPDKTPSSPTKDPQTKSDAGKAKDVEKEVPLTLESPDVCTKYTTAGTIANKVLQAVIEASVDGADIYELCKLGDDLIETETSKVYNKKDKDGKKTIEKGIAYPTCVSVNEIAGNFSPLKGDSKPLSTGDVVKIDLGVHIDGYVAEVGHTIIVGSASGDKIVDRRADVVTAAWNCAEAALRTMQVGNKNSEVGDAMKTISENYKCTPVAGVLSHSTSRYVIDGKPAIMMKKPKTSSGEEQPASTEADNSGEADTVEEATFELNTAFTIDVRVTTSAEGKVRENAELRNTVYKRAPENNYILKTAKARQFISEVKKRFQNLPFSLRNIEDEQCARVGVSEASRHKLLIEYPSMTDRPGEFVACFKFTVLLLSGGSKKISGLSFSTEANNKIVSSAVLTEESKAILAKSAAPRKKRANKKKKEDSSEPTKSEEKADA